NGYGRFHWVGIDRFFHFGIKNEFYFAKDLYFREEFFIAKEKVSLIKTIDINIDESIYIGGKNETILPFDEFRKLIKSFPTTHEIKLYRAAKVTSIISNYFESVKDKETQYKTYVNNKSIKIESNLKSAFKESEILKYSTLLDKLRTMLNNEIKYSEDQWQSEILQLVLLIYPKYIKAIKELKFKDVYSEKTRRLDFGLIDFMGNLDIMEIKIPFEKSIVSKSQYRDNHIPNRDLSGVVMQIEKYIFYLNKIGKQGEIDLNKKYKSNLPNGLEIKIVNPSAIIIMGRDNHLSKSQLYDFEVIKRKYKNVIDVFTYDELIRRLDILIKQLKTI
ncbi:Shedu immune nuclease family protein, partial [Anaerophaga thermohalophila]|uniref:Shedu immune nuclease family protein n=1 Tax=Anaerophaga thermohalophila TaxID=177400 RepID=UPI000237D21E